MTGPSPLRRHKMGGAERLLRLAVPADQIEMILGDLAEACQRRRLGARWAWYWGHAVVFLIVYGTFRLRQPLDLVRDALTGRVLADALTGGLADIRISFRGLTRGWGYLAVTATTIALGVGASTAIFSIVRGVLMTPLDIPESNRVVSLWTDEGGLDYGPLTVPDFKAIDREIRGLENVAARWMDDLPLLGDQEPEEVRVAAVTEGYFNVLGIAAAMGTLLDWSDPRAVVIGDALWRRRFGASPSVIGSTIRLGLESYYIVGVLPASPSPNVPDMAGVIEDTDVWRVMPDAWLDWGWDIAFLRVTAKLRSGVTVEELNDELATFMRALNPTAGRGPDELNVFAIALRDHVVATVRPALVILLGAVALLLIIACANVAQLTLARVSGRRAELAVRSALGGSRVRVARSVIAESLVVAMIGGTLGTILAWLAIRGLLAMQPATLPRVDEIRMTLSVLGFAIAATLGSALFFGLAPAVHGTTGPLAGALRSRNATRSRKFKRGGKGLVIAEVTLTFVLLAGSGLLIRTFAALTAVDPGYESKNLITMSVTPTRGAEDSRERIAFLRELESATLDLRGVRSVGFANRLPLTGGVYNGEWATRETFGDADRAMTADIRFVSPRYHEALGIDLIAGRPFEPTDSSHVVIVDASLARVLGGDVVGREIWTGAFGIEGWATIVGVVEHARHASIVEDALATIYYSAFAEPGTSTWRTAIRVDERAQLDVVPAFRAALRRIDPGATVSRVRTMKALVGDALAVHRMALTVLGAFALGAAALAALGIYGLLSLTVSQRRREIAVRVALGASVVDITKSVIGEGARVILVGLGVGATASLGLNRLLVSLLYKVEPADPLVLLAASVGIALLGLAGAFVPARHAISVDPMTVLEN